MMIKLTIKPVLMLLLIFIKLFNSKAPTDTTSTSIDNGGGMMTSAMKQ